MFEEASGPGVWSSTRFAFVFSVLTSNIVVFVSYAYLAFKNGQLPDVPEGTLWLFALANGIAFTGKVVQKNKEQQ